MTFLRNILKKGLPAGGPGFTIFFAVLVSSLALAIGLAIYDLVVESTLDKNAVDIVDFKFVESFSGLGARKTLFIIQAIFNFYTVREIYKRPVKRFILVDGGGGAHGPPCEPLHYHGYIGMEAEAVKDITDWIANPSP